MGQCSSSAEDRGGGGGLSKPSVATREQMILWAMPPYCTREPAVTGSILKLVNDNLAWMLSGSSPSFKEAVGIDRSATPLTFFYNSFYNCLFEMLPQTRSMFKKGISTQGRMLTSMLTAALKLLGEDKIHLLTETLVNLAKRHNAYGVTAPQYTVVGLVLLHTIRKCSGAAAYTPEIEGAWVEVYSLILKVMMPVVIDGLKPDPDAVAAVAPAPSPSPSPLSTDAHRTVQQSPAKSPRKSPLIPAPVNVIVVAASRTEASALSSPVVGPATTLHPSTAAGVCPMGFCRGSASAASEPLLPPGHPPVSDDAAGTPKMRPLGLVSSSSSLALHCQTSKYGALEAALVLAERMEEQIELHERTVGFTKFTRTFTGAQAHQWMVSRDIATGEGHGYLTLLLDLGIMICVQALSSDLDDPHLLSTPGSPGSPGAATKYYKLPSALTGDAAAGQAQSGDRLTASFFPGELYVYRFVQQANLASKKLGGPANLSRHSGTPGQRAAAASGGVPHGIAPPSSDGAGGEDVAASPITGARIHMMASTPRAFDASGPAPEPSLSLPNAVPAEGESAD